MILLRPTPTRVLDIEEFLTDKKFSNGRVCHHCGKSHIVRNGHRADGTQRYNSVWNPELLKMIEQMMDIMKIQE